MTTDVEFCRLLLKLVLGDVRKHDSSVRPLDAWVWKFSSNHWEFHYGEFYWHGSASNAYEARCNGWTLWLARVGASGYSNEEK